MLAANYNITLDRAADYGFVLTIQDAVFAPVDITSATFYADIRNVATKTEAVEFTVTPTNPLSGIVTFSLSKADTKTLKAGEGLYEWDIFMVLGGTTRRLLYGSVSVRPQFTNDV
jgi:hypothetical protein